MSHLVCHTLSKHSISTNTNQYTIKTCQVSSHFPTSNKHHLFIKDDNDKYILDLKSLKRGRYWQWRVFCALHLAEVPTLLRFPTAQPTFHGHSHFLIQSQPEYLQCEDLNGVLFRIAICKEVCQTPPSPPSPHRASQVVWPVESFAKQLLIPFLHITSSRLKGGTVSRITHQSA